MFSVLDIIFFGIIFLFAIICFFEGFINAIFKMGSPFVALWVSILFYSKMTFYLSQFISNEKVSAVLSFVLIFILAFLVMKILQQIIGNIFSGKIFKSLDRILGLAFGCLEGFAFVFILIFVMTVQNVFDVSSLFENSFFYNFISKFDFAIIPNFGNILNTGKIQTVNAGAGTR